MKTLYVALIENFIDIGFTGTLYSYVSYLLCCRRIFCSCGNSGRQAVMVEAITRMYHVTSESVTDTQLLAGTDL